MGSTTQRAKGKAEAIGGAIEKKVGEVIGNDKMAREGAQHEAKGKARQAVAKAGEQVKGTVEKGIGAVKSAVGEVVGNERLEAEGDRETLKGKARKALNR